MLKNSIGNGSIIIMRFSNAYITGSIFTKSQKSTFGQFTVIFNPFYYNISQNKKFSGKRSILRFTCSFSLLVSTPYSSAKSRSSITCCLLVTRIREPTFNWSLFTPASFTSEVQGRVVFALLELFSAIISIFC